MKQPGVIRSSAELAVELRSIFEKLPHKSYLELNSALILEIILALEAQTDSSGAKTAAPQQESTTEQSGSKNQPENQRIRWCITQLLTDLPQRRDWLNPDIEKELRSFAQEKPAD